MSEIRNPTSENRFNRKGTQSSTLMLTEGLKRSVLSVESVRSAFHSEIRHCISEIGLTAEFFTHSQFFFYHRVTRSSTQSFAEFFCFTQSCADFTAESRRRIKKSWLISLICSICVLLNCLLGINPKVHVRNPKSHFRK